MSDVVALSLCVAGPVALRFGWRRRGAPVAFGWAALTLAAIMLARQDGAWGLAAGSTATMLSAMALLAQAALATAPPRRAAAARTVATQPPDPIEWADMRRRVSVFLVVVVLDLAASLAVAWSVQRALFRGGSDPADLTALALLLHPLLWLGLASWQLTRGRLSAMFPAPVALIAVGGIIWLTT